MIATQLELPLPETTSRWCQRWAGQRQTWQYADPSERFDATRYEVHPIDDTTAAGYVRANHYLGSYPAASRRYGLFRAGQLAGVAVYSIPVQASVLTLALPDLEPYTESLELGRLVLGDSEPGNSETWFLARCHEQLLDAGVRGVVSFADPLPRSRADGVEIKPGHVGIVYQAANARYTGRATPRSLALLPDGSTFSDRAKQKIRRQERGHEYAEQQLIAWGARPMRAGEKPAIWLAAALEEAGARRVRHLGNHRYVFALGRTRRDRDRIRIGFDRAAYPKRPDRRALELAA